MSVTVLFFGLTADLAGCRSVEFDDLTNTSVAGVVNRVVAEYPSFATLKLLFSINQKYTAGNELVRDGDEIAIFTAVSGG